MNNKVKVTELTCLRCGHKWIPRQAIVYVCPKCKNAKWNVPKNNDQDGD